MAAVTITIEDTPAGGISFHSSFAPAVGLPLSPAQVCALEMSNRTRKQWGLAPAAHKLQQGKALVICGAQGSGKTRLAVDIAKRYSSNHHTAEFGPSFDQQVYDALCNKAQVLIIDGTPSKAELGRIKNFLTAKQTKIRPPWGKTSIVVPTPVVIICTMALGWLTDEDSRRIDVIELGKRAVQ